MADIKIFGTLVNVTEDNTIAKSTQIKHGSQFISNILDKVVTVGDDGKIPGSKLPSYVDDVLEFAKLVNFPTNGESGKIYVALDTNKTYRWSGSKYIEISPSIALGQTSSTAYPGDLGKQNADDIKELQNDTNTFQQNLDNLNEQFGNLSQTVEDNKTELEGKINNKINDAPDAQKQYARQKGSWVEINVKPSSTDVSYDNETSGLSAVNVQQAIDELNNNDLEVEDYDSEEIPGLDDLVIERLNDQDTEIDKLKLDIQKSYSEFVDAAGGVKSITDANIIKKLTSMDSIPKFDSTVSYKQNDIVNYNGQPYYFEKDHSGPWIGTDAVVTDLFALIMQARGQIFTGETVNIKLHCEDSSVPLDNVKIVCNFEDGSIQKVAYTDENGEATFFVAFGKKYGISAANIGDFHSEKKIFYASAFTRNVTIDYKYFKYGIYAYFEDGTKIHYNSWKNNRITINENFSPLIGAAYYDELEHWVLTGHFVYSNTIKGSGPTYQNLNPTTASKNCDEAFITNQQYINDESILGQAANKTITIGNVTKNAFLPSVTQLHIYDNNYSTLNDIMNTIAKALPGNRITGYIPFLSNNNYPYVMDTGNDYLRAQENVNGIVLALYLVD